MCSLLGSVIGIAGTVVGAFLGYFMSVRASEKHFRRTVLRDIAFEYRRLAESRSGGHVQGLIQAGICQCRSDKEYAAVLDLVDDLNPKIESGSDWRPSNGKYVEYFALLKKEGKDPTNGQQLKELKNRVERG